MSKDHELKGIVHGDDFMFTGEVAQLAWLRKKFEDRYECKVEVVGFGPGVARSARFLNRVVTYIDTGIEFEADQRLVEALIDDLNLERGKTSPSPGTKPRPKRRLPWNYKYSS